MASLQSHLKNARLKIEQLEQRKRLATASNPLERYTHDPVGYARNVLKVTPTPDQAAVARSILEAPYRLLVKSGHNVGKTFLSAWLVNWWYDTRPQSTTITTAPTHRDVVDLLWTEVRLQRQRAGLPDHFIGPAAPEMRTGPEHYAKGYTSSRSAAPGQGRHRPHMFFVFEEAEGIDAVYWNTANTMFQPDGTSAFLAILNPTTTTSASYQEERATDVNGVPKWRTFTISSLNHPNIAEQLAGRPPIIPTAVTLEQVRSWLGEWFEPVPKEDVDPDTDIEFPPGSGQWHRPGPEGESRVLGRRPTAGAYGVWSERAWQRVCTAALSIPLAVLPEIGCDVARYGTDRTEMHSRCGPCSLAHEDHSGWATVRTANRLMSIAADLASWFNGRRVPGTDAIRPEQIPIKVDDTGVGGGVTDILESNGYNAVAVNAGGSADSDGYPRVRDELWFQVRERARNGQLDISRIPAKVRSRLEVQALAPVWKPTADRRRQVESKEETKKRIGRSPDGMDAMHLAYYERSNGDVATWLEADLQRPSRREPGRRDR